MVSLLFCFVLIVERFTLRVPGLEARSPEGDLTSIHADEFSVLLSYFLQTRRSGVAGLFTE